MTPIDLVNNKAGDTISLILEWQPSSSSPASIVDQVEASFRSVDADFKPINTAVNLSFSVAYSDPDKRWTLTLGSGSTEVIPDGIYVADVKITFVGGEVVHSDSVYYQIGRSVT